MRRPIGITILSLLFIIGGLFSIIVGASMFIAVKDIKTFISQVKEQIKEFENEKITPEILETVIKVTSISMLGLGIISLIIGWGLWNLLSWARILAIIFLGFGVLSGLISFFAQPYFLIEVAINLFIIWYLMKSDIIRAFEKRSIEEEILGENFN